MKLATYLKIKHNTISVLTNYKCDGRMAPNITIDFTGNMNNALGNNYNVILNMAVHQQINKIKTNKKHSIGVKSQKNECMYFFHLDSEPLSSMNIKLIKKT